MTNFVRFYQYSLLTALLFVGSTMAAVAQNKPLTPNRDSLYCAAPQPTPAEIRALEARIKLAMAVKQASGDYKAGVTTYVPIRPHIFRRSNGTGGMTLNSLNNVLAITNSFYHDNGSGIQFYFCGTSPDYIDNDALFAAFSETNEAVVNGRDATNAINGYFVSLFDDPAMQGYASLPTNSLESTRLFIRTSGLSDQYMGSYIVNHELGHTFGLYHTFQGSSPTQTEELVTRGAGANCSFAGDFLCDTPADPRGRNGATTSVVNGCLVYTGTITDPNGEPYNPQMNNIMSYYDGCNPQFTVGQYNRIQGGLATRQSATNYSIDCPPTAVAAVSNLIATPGSNGGIVLTWQDNASNEMGYFIERSTSPTGVFVSVGGIGPNVNTFTDLNTTPYNTYSYRIRPSNSTTGGLSGVASATAGASYCRPTFSQGCADLDGLDSFTLNGTTMSQNSGCSSSAYSQFVTPVPVLEAGQTVAVAGRFLGTKDREGVTIWGDLNRNGTYEASEQLYQTPTSLTAGFSGNLTIPANTVAGALSIRVVVAYSTSPGNPCGTYGYGETEDYRVQLAAGCTTQFTTRVGNWNDPSLWSCNRVPTATDPVEVRHTVTVPASTTVSALRVTYTSGGKITFGASGKLRLGL